MQGIELIAHRGASREAPENTLASFRRAWSEGADGIEGDYRLTRDGEIVCIHDATTRRTAGIDLSVADTDYARLRTVDVGSWKGGAWRGERIPSIREVIATVPAGKKLYLELKSGPEIVPPLSHILAESDLKPEQVVILAFSEEVIAEARRQLPRIRGFWLTDFKRDLHGGWTPPIQQILETLERTGASGLSCKAHHSINQTFVRALRVAGMEFHVWTVDTMPIATRFTSLGVDSITTNRPAWLRTRLHNATARF